MDPLAIVIAAITGVAILLIFIGVFGGGGSGVTARLERYASGEKAEKPKAAGSGSIGDMLQQSVALAQLNRVVEQRDFGANLARDLARADLKLKPSEFLAVWGGMIVGVPALMILLSPIVSAFSSPLLWVVGAVIGSTMLLLTLSA